MAFSLLPKEIKFFDLFDQQTAIIISAAACFKELADQGKFDDQSIERMRVIEHQGDEITHEIVDKLNRCFITPFDREDIHCLAFELDNVIDIIYTLTKRMRLYKLNVADPGVIKFAELIEQAVYSLSQAIKELRDTKNPKKILKHCIEINRLENMGDQLRDSVIEKLFNDGSDPITVIKWKEIYEGAETCLDICEDIANVLESILVKQG